MKMLICAVRDQAIGAFMQPFFSRSEGEAMRGFSDACKDDKMPFRAHLADYSLFVLGAFDDQIGEIVPEVSPRKLVDGLQFQEVA